MAYPNLNNDPGLIKFRNIDNETKELKYKTEKHDHEDIS